MFSYFLKKLVEDDLINGAAGQGELKPCLGFTLLSAKLDMT